MTMTIKVVTKYNAEQIIQDTVVEDADTAYSDYVRLQMMNLRERGVQEALIKLGWTPPPPGYTQGDEDLAATSTPTP